MTALQARVDALLRALSAQASSRNGALHHVIAYSGGVDSSLAAALVKRVFPTQSAACLGVSPSLAAHQLAQARRVAAEIDIPLWECKTTEGDKPQYVENKGQSCYYCKTTLYETIQQATAYAMNRVMTNGSGEGADAIQPVLYNGTNADDMKDPTRVGLVAAKEFEVVSPLRTLTKAEVRETAKYLGLSNWNAAASPCLRSRLEFGVEATQHHLQQVERAETFLRSELQLSQAANMRVRFLAGHRAAVELDNALLETALGLKDLISRELVRIGFSDVTIRSFRSGSLSGYNPTVDVLHSPRPSGHENHLNTTKSGL